MSIKLSLIKNNLHNSIFFKMLLYFILFFIFFIFFIFFSTFIYTDLIYRVCCWKIEKLNTTETEKKIKKNEEKKKSLTKGLNLTITKNGSIFLVE